eukprot:5057335-Amphidinium_carterae.1
MEEIEAIQQEQQGQMKLLIHQAPLGSTIALYKSRTRKQSFILCIVFRHWINSNQQSCPVLFLRCQVLCQSMMFGL